MCRRSLLPPDPGATEPAVLPLGSPTTHLLPLWASAASRERQHQERAVELLPVGCPSSLIRQVLLLSNISVCCMH